MYRTTNGGATTGLYGQSLVSGGALGAFYNAKLTCASFVASVSNPNVNNSSFTDILGNAPINLTSGYFMTSPLNKYIVRVNGTFTGVDDLVKIELQISTGTGGNFGGQTFNSTNDCYYYAQNVNANGAYRTTISIEDIFDTSFNPLTIGGVCYVYLLVQSGNGSHTISNGQFNISITPYY